MTPHVSPLRASYGVSFTTYTQNNDRDISGAQIITKKSDSIVNSPSGSKYTEQKCTSGGKYGNHNTTTKLIGWFRCQIRQGSSATKLTAFV